MLTSKFFREILIEIILSPTNIIFHYSDQWYFSFKSTAKAVCCNMYASVIYNLIPTETSKMFSSINWQLHTTEAHQCLSETSEELHCMRKKKKDTSTHIFTFSWNGNSSHFACFLQEHQWGGKSQKIMLSPYRENFRCRFQKLWLSNWCLFFFSIDIKSLNKHILCRWVAVKADRLLSCCISEHHFKVPENVLLHWTADMI